MCYERNGNYQIAEEDIECIKVMRLINGVLHSMCWNVDKEYKIGDFIISSYVPEIKLPRKYFFATKKFRRMMRKKLFAQHIDEHIRFLEAEVVHSYIPTDPALILRSYRSLVLVRCIIPKGEIYWKNVSDQEYASFSVKIVGIIDCEDNNNI